MKIPNNHTEEEVLAIIEKVSKRFANRYTFGYYETEDILQECFLIALEGLQHYDGYSPLENFLAVCVNNRLKNFIRDNFYRRPAEGEPSPLNLAKRNLMEPIDITETKYEGETSLIIAGEQAAVLEQTELMELIDGKLPVSFRSDYVRLREGDYLPKQRKDELVRVIWEILGEDYGS